MQYKIKILKAFEKSAFEADSHLYAVSSKAADNFYNNYNSRIELIRDNPFIFQMFEGIAYFRSAPLIYGYRLFYHIDEKNKTVILHRILHGAMDLERQLSID